MVGAFALWPESSFVLAHCMLSSPQLLQTTLIDSALAFGDSRGWNFNQGNLVDEESNVSNGRGAVRMALFLALHACYGAKSIRS